MYENRPQKLIAIIEARMTSSRLPGKVLLPIAQMPALELLIRRLQKSRYLDGICVATTMNGADDAIVECVRPLGVAVFRGSESDVLGRVLGAAQSQSADIIIEITGDCPFIDPEIVDRTIDEFFKTGSDYTSPAGFPNGFDVGVFATKTLSEVTGITDDPVDRTHVSYYIYTHPNTYRIQYWNVDQDSYGPELRVTLDEESDYEVIQTVANAFQNQLMDFRMSDVVKYLRLHPKIIAMNKDVRQKEAYEL